MNKQNNFSSLTDEEILSEFVKRFECDGAILIYLDSKAEFGFGKWRNATGKQWVKDIFSVVKSEPSTLQKLKYQEQNFAVNYCQA